MKLKKKDIDRIINILEQKKKELENEDDEYVFEFVGAKEKVEMKAFPSEWCIEVTEENRNIIELWRDGHNSDIGGFVAENKYWSSVPIRKYIISTEDFMKFVIPF